MVNYGLATLFARTGNVVAKDICADCPHCFVVIQQASGRTVQGSSAHVATPCFCLLFWFTGNLDCFSFRALVVNDG